jgi:hypothetical protein
MYSIINMSLGREVLIIKIKLDNNSSDIISVRERDEPNLLAARFCKKHKLSQKTMKAITFMIDYNLDVLIDEELASQSPKKAPPDLYSKGLNQKAKFEEKIKKMKTSIDEEKSKLLTFKPILCQQSIELLKNPQKPNRPSLASTSRLKNPNTETPKNQKSGGNLKIPNKIQETPKNSEYSGASSKDLIPSNSFSFQSKPLSIFQNFKDFSNNKLKSMLRNS